jgi:ribonuclease BN (tRNA processing enzyme)
VVLSHLHGDHFGGLPFLLLDAQFLSRRTRPLLIAGPPGTRQRLDAALEVFFPKSSGSAWKFGWEVMEIAVGVPADVLGHSLVTAEVIHGSGAPSTALRLSDGRFGDGETVFAYSGDTEWTDALLPIARGADLFVCECYAFAGRLTGHMSWDILQSRLGDLAAKRTMVTHMNPTVLARLDAVRAAGVLVAEDGLTLSF